MQVRKRLTAVLATGFLAVATACQPAAQEGGTQEAAAVDTAAIMASLDSVRTAFEEAFTAGDVGTMASYYTQDAMFAGVGGPPVTGRPAIRSSMEEQTPPEGATVSIEPASTQILSSDWAWEVGVTTASFTPEGEDVAQEMSHNYLVVLHRTANGWRLAAEATVPQALPSSSGM